jgi:hypothetical protein
MMQQPAAVRHLLANITGPPTYMQHCLKTLQLSEKVVSFLLETFPLHVSAYMVIIGCYNCCGVATAVLHLHFISPAVPSVHTSDLKRDGDQIGRNT